MKKNYVSNSKESVRMFKQDWMEALSKVHFSVPLYIYIPVILYLCWKAFAHEHLGVLQFICFFLLGLLFWTFSEYVLHRFVFHYYPTSKWGQRIHFIFHGVHHDYPNDAKRLVMPPSASIPMALGIYWLLSLVLPTNVLYAFFAGFILGYLTYDISHYALHHFNFKSSFWQKLKKHHMLHHYSDANKGYGVSSPLWDKIFKSDF
ncbi:MAG: sterol desaturase family protein [Bacteroidota bacterium]|nr:sterol desaturase family protein [Bacteroidota bacterium]